MGFCSVRCFALAICVLQLISTVERQVFDFLGYMWVPIIGNFFQIIFTILGFFGIYQYRPKYIFVCVIWMLIWVGWNVFIICFYLQVGSLSRDSSILNMATGSRSWWEDNGVGCTATYNDTEPGEESWRKPASVEGCLLEYYYVECAQAGLQIFLALCSICSGCYIIKIFTQEDDSSPTRRNGTLVPYSIEYQRHPTAAENPYQRPMTPRKVKRRSTRSRRSYRQSYYQNPVTKLMERSVDSSTSNDSYGVRQTEDVQLPPYRPGRGQVNLAFQPPSRPTSAILNGRPSPIYMNDTETVI